MNKTNLSSEKLIKNDYNNYKIIKRKNLSIWNEMDNRLFSNQKMFINITKKKSYYLIKNRNEK